MDIRAIILAIMIKSEDVLLRADDIYRDKKRAKGIPTHYIEGIQSDQVKSLCEALVEEINEEFKKLYDARRT